MDATYRIEALQTDHERKAFSCGVEALDRYLIQQAGQDNRRRVAATYVISEHNSNRAAGYYTLSSSNILLRELPQEIIKKLPRYPSLPATLLGRLAVDQAWQGKKLGELLLIDALKRSLKLSTEIASMAVIVDAKNIHAEQFYLRYGFIPFLDTNRLFLPIATIEKIW